MTQDIAAIVLAAGMGTRMKSPVPKVLNKVAGWTMLQHSLTHLKEISPKHVVTVIGSGMDNVIEEAQTVFPETITAIQKERLGTGHAVQQAAPELKNFEGIVLVLYGDTPFITHQTQQRLIDTLKKEEATVAVLGFHTDKSASYGRLITSGKTNELEAIIEYKDASEEQRAITLCNSGVMAIHSDHLYNLLEKIDNNNAKQEYYLTDIIAIARKASLRCVYVEGDEAEMLGINSQSERSHAEALLQEQLRQAMLDKGVTLIAPETNYFCMDTEIAPGAIIHPYVICGLEVTIETGTEIKPFCHLEGTTIKLGSVVGPFARIRPGTTIEEDCKVGNFVEIKNTTLKQGAKASHLSYIGDATIGEEANIGAGTITCNYDGYQKHYTEIGDHTFIGSNSSLVAPVTIGKGAIVGAGSTITKNVTDDALAINEMPQKETLNKAKELRNKQRSG